MEKREIVFVLSILLLLASCEGQQIIGPFDYFQIVLSWQPAVCSDENLRVDCWRAPGERFSIHVVFGPAFTVLKGLSPVQYFALGLNAFALHNIQSILTANNTRPNGSTYSRTRVEAAIAAATGIRPALRCNRNYWSGSQQLHEISLCYSKFASGLEHCPPNANKCPNQFVWNSWRTSQRNIEVESI